MRAAIAGLRPKAAARLVRAADWAGTAVRSLPGAGGALALAYGAGEIYGPLFWIVAGGFLLALDRRMP
jgi:hypothetical protein